MSLRQSTTRLLAAFAIFLSIQNNSLASPIQLNFSESNIVPGPYPELTINNQGLELHIYAETQQLNSVQVYIDKFGLGAKLESGSDGPEIDNLGPDESLVLSFSENVQLLEATFSQIGLNDDVIIDNQTHLFTASFSEGNSSDTGRQTLAFSNFLGSEFHFFSQGTYSEYSLESISFIPTTVTAPATLPILLFGTLLLVLQRKRQIV